MSNDDVRIARRDGASHAVYAKSYGSNIEDNEQACRDKIRKFVNDNQAPPRREIVFQAAESHEMVEGLVWATEVQAIVSMPREK